MRRTWQFGAVALMAAVLLFPSGLLAQNVKDLTKPPGSEWLTYGGSLTNQRYSTLDQLTPANVKGLNGQWAIHLGSGIGTKYSFEATPLMQDGVLYIPTGNDDIFAVDARTGSLLWQWKSGLDQNITTVCCGWDNRGVALGEGKVFSGMLDGSFVALDQKSGEVLWRTQVGTWQDGYTITAAPRYFEGMVFTGISGAEKGVRGKLTALDAKSGQELWHFWTVPGPGDIGGDTWPDDGFAYLHGGATVWNTPTIDPDLGLLYFSTGNAGPDYLGSVRPGDNLFASSIVALDYRTGQYKWHFQETHHDIWDYDAPSPTVLFDISINGQNRKAVAQPGKTGFVYILDRANGQPLIGIEERAVPQEPRQATAATQPYPVGDAVVPQCATPLPGWPLAGCIFTPFWDVATIVKPWAIGGVNWAPMSFSPQTGFLYVSAIDRPGAFAAQPQEYSAEATAKTGLSYSGSRPVAPLLGAKIGGTYTAIDARTNKIAWQKQMPYAIGQGSGTLSTAGGLLFHGEPDGNFLALDARTGDELWRWQTGYGADAPAITYELDGQQYVVIAAGGVTTLQGSENGDAVWAFTLKGKLQPFQAPKPPATVIDFTGPVTSTNTVKVQDFSFDPGRSRVAAGASMTWTNSGAQAHTATASDGSWDTGAIAPGQSASLTLTTPGIYTYVCTPHPWMIAQLTVDPS
jgi:quinohemoprotein ethanol dehydrogenase